MKLLLLLLLLMGCWSCRSAGHGQRRQQCQGRQRVPQLAGDALGGATGLGEGLDQEAAHLGPMDPGCMRGPCPHRPAGRGRLAGVEHLLGDAHVQRRGAAQRAAAPLPLHHLLEPLVAQSPGLNYQAQVLEGEVAANEGEPHALCRRQEEGVDCAEGRGGEGRGGGRR